MSNQNYEVNRLIKEMVDKNQKNYVASEEEEQEQTPIIEDISVKVENSQKEPVEGAVVELVKYLKEERQETEEKYSGTTGKAGGCTIKNVPYGYYMVYIKVVEGSPQKQGMEINSKTLNLVYKTQQITIEGQSFEETEEDEL